MLFSKMYVFHNFDSNLQSTTFQIAGFFPIMMFAQVCRNKFNETEPTLRKKKRLIIVRNKVKLSRRPAMLPFRSQLFIDKMSVMESDFALGHPLSMSETETELVNDDELPEVVQTSHVCASQHQPQPSDGDTDSSVGT